MARAVPDRSDGTPDWHACADVVRKGDADRFLVAMSAPVDARARLFPILALNVELSRAPWITEEPIIAQMRLQWWRDMVGEAMAGAPDRAHEVAAPLARVIREAGLAQDALEQLISARQWDIDREPFPSEADFAAHMDALGGALLWLSAAALGAPDALEPAVRGAGRAMALAGWLTAIPEFEARGRIPLVDGRPEAVRVLARQGLGWLSEARRALKGADAAAPALRLASLATPLLKQAAGAPARVARGDLGLSEAHKRLRIAGKALVGGW